jgi:MFS family permease
VGDDGLMAATVAPVRPQHRPPEIARLQRRTLILLACTQIAGGIGVATGVAVGALLAADMAGTKASGLAGSAAVIGAALIAIPATRIMRARGRRPGLAFTYVLGVAGAAAVVGAIFARSPLLLFLGTFLFGGGSAGNLQSRYAAIDLAEPDRRARQLSLVVWVSTVGAIVGPNLAPVANGVADGWGLLEYTGPYLLSAVAFGLAAVALTVFMRPDPLLVARAREEATSQPGSAGHAVWRDAIRAVRASSGARLGLVSVASGHVVMVGVMSMTPVYIGGYVHRHGDQLQIVGLVISLHIVGMYALSPLVGWLTDRFGPRKVVAGGVGVLLVACALAGTAGDSTVRLAFGMSLLGVGWLGCMVAGSMLVSSSVPADRRTGAQGLSDVVMGIAAALAGALAGVVVDYFGYPTLTLLAAIAVVPLAALALRTPDPVAPAAGDDDGRLVGCG